MSKAMSWRTETPKYRQTRRTFLRRMVNEELIGRHRVARESAVHEHEAVRQGDRAFMRGLSLLDGNLSAKACMMCCASPYLPMETALPK